MMANNPMQQRLNTTTQAFTNKSQPLQQMEDEEPLQGKFETESEPAQLDAAAEAPRPNNTGLPDNLKLGIENLSGISMDHVKVHNNSSKPAPLQAHAYAQGGEIHVAPGQERHLPHEAWHVVQQAQGRVKPTIQIKGNVQVNDDAGLEAEADLMGARALQMMGRRKNTTSAPISIISNSDVIQGEFATATSFAADETRTATSKDHPAIHWVVEAMNKVASVKPKKVPDGEGGEVEVEGNAKFQCAEPKSMSMALSAGLDWDEKITLAELNGIRLTDIKWCEGARDGQPACTCPTCSTWLDSPTKGAAKPSQAAKDAVKSTGEGIDKFFDDDTARDKKRKKEIAEKKNYELYGQYVDAVQKDDVTDEYYVLKDIIDEHRQKFVRYIECNEEIAAENDKKDKVVVDGDSKARKLANKKIEECDEKIKTLKNEKKIIIQALNLNTD
jgi:DNA-binding protein H-NS